MVFQIKKSEHNLTGDKEFHQFTTFLLLTLKSLMNEQTRIREYGGKTATMLTSKKLTTQYLIISRKL